MTCDLSVIRGEMIDAQVGPVYDQLAIFAENAAGEPAFAHAWDGAGDEYRLSLLLATDYTHPARRAVYVAMARRYAEDREDASDRYLWEPVGHVPPTEKVDLSAPLKPPPPPGSRLDKLHKATPEQLSK